MNLSTGKSRNSKVKSARVVQVFPFFPVRILLLGLLELFYSAFLLDNKITCAEKKLITLDRRGGYAPKTGNSQIDFDLWFRLPAGFHFWPVNCHLTNSTFPDCFWFSSGLKILLMSFGWVKIQNRLNFGG